MPDTAERCHDGIHWYPYVTVEKYSPDQTAYAEARNAELLAAGDFRGYRNAVPRSYLKRRRGHYDPRDVHSDFLHGLFPKGPEGGYAYDEGNLLVNAGLVQIINLLVATAQSNSYRALWSAGVSSTLQTVCGVGSSSTAATTSDVHLGGDGSTTTAYYQGMDSGFPSLTGNTVINGQCTYASANANFAWNEWCWATGVGTITAGGTLGSTNVFATALAGMWNHKIPAGGLGTKASGASWVFTTTITFS